jgi:hypothetical protein
MKANLVSGALFLFLPCATAVSAQMAVHGAVGTVKAVRPHTIAVVVDGDAPTLYVTTPTDHAGVKLESDLRADSMDAVKMQTLGEAVLVYYYGFGSDTTAVAIKDLGASPYTKVQGTVTAFDKKSRVLTLKDEKGKEVTAQLADTLVVDTDMGVESGKKFAPHIGDKVRVTFLAGATPTVTFLREVL